MRAPPVWPPRASTRCRRGCTSATTLAPDHDRHPLQPAEYAVTTADPSLLARATAATSARLNPLPDTVFAADNLPAGDARAGLWPWLLLLALVLAPIDVGLRRLRLERADWARTRAWARGWSGRRRGGRPAGRGGSGPTASRDATTDALFAAKRRAGDRHRSTASTAREPADTSTAGEPAATHLTGEPAGTEREHQTPDGGGVTR